MRLPFLDREEETARLKRLTERREGSLGVLYGRRRCGKSRLLREVLVPDRSVYYVGDDREGALQRSSVAREIGRLLPGFDRVAYPDWDALIDRWWGQAPPGSVLALDEFPALVNTTQELPSVLQKHVDRLSERRIHLALAGSSQRMMQGLVLDRTAPLYGRAAEILRISPLAPGWIGTALDLSDSIREVEAYSVWGGIPRYWELAADFSGLSAAVHELVLDPLGVLYEEPSRLLLDDLRDTTQAASILSLIGQGCHRISEIAGRLGKPATSLSRPLQRLVEMGLVERESPFGSSLRTSKRTLYRVSDPFLRYWFRFVEPNRSRLEARQLEVVESEISQRFSHHVGEIWEELARASVQNLSRFGKTWGPASRWWGAGLDRRPLEVDLVAESTDGKSLLLGEVKWATPRNAGRILARLEKKVARLPFVDGRETHLTLWLRGTGDESADERWVGPREVLDALR